MTQEEQNIKQKIENLSDLDFSIDDANLWNRLEQRLDEKAPQKPKFLWLWWVAASLLIGMFVFTQFDEKPLPKVAITPNEKIEIKDRTATKSTPKKEVLAQIIASPRPLLQGEGEGLSEINSLLLKGEGRTAERLGMSYNEQKQLNIELNKLNFKDNFDSLTFNKKAISVQPKFKVQQVTVVDFPIIPDEMMKREVFAKRLFRQIKSFNTEGKIDWRELNIEPRNVWAYLERNFKYDSISIQNKKHIKQ